MTVDFTIIPTFNRPKQLGQCLLKGLDGWGVGPNRSSV
jgi:hypothetical protein